MISLRPPSSRFANQIKRIERKLDLILEHLGLPFQEEIPVRIAQMLARGQKIEAIRIYQMMTNLGFDDAKQMIESFQKRLRDQAGVSKPTQTEVNVNNVGDSATHPDPAEPTSN